MRRFLRRMWRDLGNGRAVDNARRNADDLMRELAAVDALAARVAARGGRAHTGRARAA